MGNKHELFQCDGTLSTLMFKGSFRLKVIVTSGETNQEKINKIGVKVLGLGWNPSADTIYATKVGH